MYYNFVVTVEKQEKAILYNIIVVINIIIMKKYNSRLTTIKLQGKFMSICIDESRNFLKKLYTNFNVKYLKYNLQLNSPIPKKLSITMSRL